MTKTENRAAFSLASIFSLRMMGLFMIYPVFAVYAQHLTGATPATIGFALGAYGLTQALFQVPFGLISDRIGRKTVIMLGLLVFALGSAVAALSGSIHGVIIGRILQGAGAVGSTLLALNADLTRVESRTKAMAIVGISIGFSFALAVIIGPLLDTWIGVSGIFWFTALLALMGIAILFGVVPTPARTGTHREAQAVPALFGRVMANRQLLRLDFGIFALHVILTASFLALPEVLLHDGGLGAAQQWMFYLPVLTASLVAMFPLIILAEARRKMKPVFLGAIVALGLAELALWAWHHTLGEFAVLLAIFFAAFNLMEASLPSLISKEAPAEAKGTAMGVYSSSQFFGIFVGGTLGGWVYGMGGASGVFLFAAAVALIWFAIALTMDSPSYVSTYILDVDYESVEDAQALGGRLKQVNGVVEAVVVPADGVAYLKVDSHALDEEGLRRFSACPAEA
jgi:MFS family permease